MDLFRQHISPLLMAEDNGQGANGNTRSGQSGNERKAASLSLIGQHHEADESATAALPSTHLNRLALHLTYGMATAATTQLLKRMSE